ncbi:MAG: flagellar basal body P-ring formation protein FlgA [Epsilonproteobacteria bacterium]|nr:flagellar basal body P-ring formation protein FlgA [Campylobacterota bacterium]
MIALQKQILILLFLSTLLFSQELQQEYIIENNVVKLSDIVKNPKKDHILYNINKTRHSKRVRSSELIEKLNAYGYNNFQTKHAYIQFSQRSPIETKKLQNALVNYYKEKYNNITIITIKEITLRPTKYIQHLPRSYTVKFPKNSYLSCKGIFYIKTITNKKLFFNYTIRAEIALYQTKKEIQKGEELSFLNLQKKSIILDKFKAAPLMNLQKNRYEAKHRLKNGLIVTQRDIQDLYLVKRGSNVVVSLHNNGIEITFSAKALQSGRMGEIISVLHEGRKIHTRVSAKNRAEVK